MSTCKSLDEVVCPSCVFFCVFFVFFFNDTATTEIYTLSLHDALPISAFDLALRLIEDRLGADIAHEVACWFQHPTMRGEGVRQRVPMRPTAEPDLPKLVARARSEEHTSELQSQFRISYAVFCLKKKKTTTTI